MEHTIIKNKVARLIFTAAAAVLCGSGILGGFNGTPGIFLYFTYLSNILIFLVFAAQTVLGTINIIGKKNYEVPSGLKGLAVISIVFTFLTVFIFLNPFGVPGSWQDARVHYLTPLLAVLDWVLFDSHCRFRFYHPICWLFSPVVYFAYVLLLAIVGVKFGGDDYFPYFFMDIFTYGWGLVMSMILLLAGIFVVFGYVMVFFDNLPMIRKFFAERRKKKALKNA